MTTAKSDIVRMRRILGIAWAASMAAACGGGGGSSRATPVTAATGPAAIDVVRVRRAIARRAAVAARRADGVSVGRHVSEGHRIRESRQRGSRLQSPRGRRCWPRSKRLSSSRSGRKPSRNCRAAEAQLSVARAKADADKGTFARLKAASATPGVVAGNDVVIAEKTADASADQVLAAEQSVEAARQALDAVRDMEGYLRVTAPFAGVITERNVHPGALVGPSTSGAGATPLLRLVDTFRLRLVVPVPEAYTAEMTPGAEIPFTVAAYPGQSFSGKVARIAQAVDVSTRTMAVELDVANGDGRLAPGTFCQVRWPVRRSGPSLFVPSASVAATTDRTFVIRIRNGKTEWVDVRTGLTSGALVEVFGDLRAGDEIAGRGTDELRPGTDVRPREKQAGSLAVLEYKISDD